MAIEIEERNSDYGFTLLMRNGQFQFGRAHVLFLDERKAKLADIIINDIEYYHCKYLPFLKKKKRYRRQGHGTRLLNEVVSCCESKGIVEIVGDIHGDMTMLIPWYEKNGFKVINGNEIMYKLDHHKK